MNYSHKQNEGAYEYLNSHLVTWTRLNKWHIQVITTGYVNQECINVESNLVREGFKTVSRKYSDKLGKTVTVYKHE